MSESIFTKIINHEIPGHFLYEDEHCVAILDRFPAVVGQALVIPRTQIDYAFDLDDDTYLHLFKVAKRIGKACDTALNAARTCLVVEGFDVPHVHIKIYPMSTSEISLGAVLPTGAEANDEDLAAIAESIKAAL